MQVLKILLPKSEEVSFRKEERTCFCRHEEQYFESIEEVRLEEQTRRDAQIIARSGAVAFYNGPMRRRCLWPIRSLKNT
jgi:shikimate kinase